MGEWIKCSERMPEDMDKEVSVDVLVFLEGNVYQAFYDKTSQCWIDTDGDELVDSIYENPTHWQPLPEPPHD